MAGSSFMEGASIRIGLDLVATASGISAITQLGQALTNLVYAEAGLPSGAPTWLAGVGAVAAGAALDALAFDSALKTIVDDASQLQFSSTQMDLALHGTSDQIAQLNPAIIEWADNSLYTTAQVHQLVQALSEHGLDVTSILHGDGQAAIQLGEAISADPVDAANLLASALQEFSSQGLNATDAANILTAAYYNGVPSASELQIALQDVGGQAATMGIPFKDLAATIDLLAQSGMSGASAGTSLRYVLQNIADPTTKAATDMNFLGLTVVNTTSPAFRKLKDELDGAGKAGQTAVAGFDGTSVGLNAMFKAAQKLGLLPLNESFNAWATASGAMSSKLFDAKGNFIGLEGTIEQIVAAIQAKAKGNPELATQLIDDMFNVRSGRAIQLLTNVKDFKDHYNRVITEIGKTSASKDAQTELDTLQGATAELKTTLTSLGASIGDTLLPPLTQLVQHINQFAGWVMKLNPDLLKFLGIFIGVGAVLSTVTALVAALVVVFAVVAAVAGTAIITTFGVVVVAIVAVAAVIALLIAHWSQLTAAVGPWVGAVGKAISQTFHDFLAVMSPLIGRFAGLGQAFSRLGTALQPLQPVLTMTLIALGAIGALIVGLLIGTIMGLVQAIATAAGGILLFVTGFIQLFTGLFAFFTDLAHLFVAAFEWVFGGETQQASDKMTRIMRQLGNDLHTIWDGIVNMILGIVTTFVGTIVAAIAGFVDGIIQWFITLYDTLVGHSIVPDMMRAIWSWFQQLPVKAVGFVEDLVKQVTGKFTDLASNMLQFGQTMMSMLAQGIRNGIGDVVGAAENAANRLRGILGFHSPPAEGPLSDSDQYMPNMMRMFATGITGNSGLFTGALNQVALAGRTAVSGSLLGLAGAAGAGASSGQSVANFNVDGKTLFSVVMDRLSGEMRMNNLGTQWR